MNDKELPELSNWQKKQAAMLYHYASTNYLADLRKMISPLVADLGRPTESQLPNNAKVVKLRGQNSHHDTSPRWTSQVWHYLNSMMTSVDTLIKERQIGAYAQTDVSNWLYMIEEYSSAKWLTSREINARTQTLKKINAHAHLHDMSMEVFLNRWDDHMFASYYPEFSSHTDTIPAFRINPDVSASTGQLLPQTGVYIAHGDRYATLQFVLTGRNGPKLRAANTFNEIGVDALTAVGRKFLWLDIYKMFEFATAEKHAAKFHGDLTGLGQECPYLAPGAVAKHAFQSRSRKWSLVEIIAGETERLDALGETPAGP